jgi:hypothetical protein
MAAGNVASWSPALARVTRQHASMPLNTSNQDCDRPTCNSTSQTQLLLLLPAKFKPNLLSQLLMQQVEAAHF